MTFNPADPADPNSLSYRLRSRRDDFLRECLLRARSGRSGDGDFRIVDLGGGAAYWQRVGLDWLAEHGFTVLCINSDGAELTRAANGSSPIELAVGDACDMAGHADNSFDLAHSNSVIEHVGDWHRVEAFAGEMRRLAPSYYVQTPYFWFPFDPHFYRVPMIHWLPKSLRSSVHRRLKAGWGEKAASVGDAMRLAESNSMLDRSQMRYLFPDADHRFEFFYAMPKSMIATRIDSTGD